MKLRNLTVTLFLICAAALVATWYGSREFKKGLLEQEAVSDAVRWAKFVASQSEEISAELAKGHISSKTRDALELASSAGGVFRYRVFDPEGIVVYASRPEDVGKLNTKPYFENLVRKGETFAKIESDEKFDGNRNVVSEAYVPLMQDGRFAGAIEVYVDETNTAARLDRAAYFAFLGVTALMFIVAIGWTFFVWRDLKIRLLLEKELMSHRDHLQELVDMATGELKEKADELKQALAKEQELSKLQREFVSMASHEFRTPLAIIDTTAQRMKSRAASNRLTPEDIEQRIGKIRDAVQRMTRLMESTLDAARMEDGKIKIEIGPCDIATVVREVCARQQEMSQTHIISSDLAGLPETIQGDSGYLEQAVENLLSNAVKYAPDAPDIQVTALAEGNQVVISVRDHGIGIDEDELGRVCERFFRARTSSGTAGTGIGLNLAKTLVEMHGGSISAESRKGESSTFTIRLPIDGPDQSDFAETRAA